VDLNIVAHQDDDILFMNPDILNAVVAGHRQVTVYITAGNIGLNTGTGYSLEREEGAIAGYSKLLQLADAIKADATHFNDFADQFQFDSRYPAGCGNICFPCAKHACELSTAGDARGQRDKKKFGPRMLNVATIGDGPGGPRVTLIFLRVDSGCNPPNIPDPGCNPPATLAQLFTTRKQSGVPALQIQSRFAQPGYTKQGLINQLVQILQFYQPDTVRTQDTADCQPGYACDQYGMTVDYPNANKIFDLGCDSTAYSQQNGEYPTNYYDHSDHVWGARFAREALRTYDHLLNVEIPSTYSLYKAYNLEWIEDQATRVTSRDFCLKKSIFFRYALHDSYATFSDYSDYFVGGGQSPQQGFDCYSYWYLGYQQSLQPGLP
jgi:LmbE family N-acetylglucosaminyl deacetylase